MRGARWLSAAVLVTAVVLAPQPAVGSDAVQPILDGSLAAQDRFYVHDRHRYSSKWYAGAHRKMVPFGCTRAPYYPPSPQCKQEHGFHHGLDIAMPCGNRLRAGIPGRVVRPGSPGALGAAYGRHAFRLRNHRHDVDVVIGHVRRVFVAPGERFDADSRSPGPPTPARLTAATCTSRRGRHATATSTRSGQGGCWTCIASLTRVAYYTKPRLWSSAP